MNATEIDWSKPVQTRHGREVKIFTREARNRDYPVQGEFACSGEEWCQAVWDSKGHYCSGESDPHYYDLINVPEKRTFWANCYKHGLDGCYETKEKADYGASSLLERIACVKVEFVIGEGL